MDHYLPNEADLQRAIIDTITTPTKIVVTQINYKVFNALLEGPSATTVKKAGHFTRVCKALKRTIYHDEKQSCSEDSSLGDIYAVTVTVPVHQSADEH